MISFFVFSLKDPQGITTVRETIFPQQGIRSGKYAVPQPARCVHVEN